MPDDLDALTTRLRADPRDPVTIQALADWLEERGAAPESVRALTVDGPTVLVVSMPDDTSPFRFEGCRDSWREVASWLEKQSGHPIMAVLSIGEVSIRAIKAEVKRDA